MAVLTSASQLPKAPKLRRKLVSLPELPDDKGEPTDVWVSELTAALYEAWRESGRVYVNGELSSVTLKDNDARFLAFTVRDPQNNRIWATPEDAVAQLNEYGRGIIAKLVMESNKVNEVNAKDAEKNSDETQNAA